MMASEGQVGRVFVLRLEDGDVIPACIEQFAAEKGIAVGHVVLLGGIGGVYHSVSEKYLQSYINEYGFRYNHRKDERPMFVTILSKVR